jgi:hypothetical protein
VTLAMPNKALSPAWGQSVGGVSERAGVKAGESNLFAMNSFTCRGGRRHPGFPEGDTLRGVSLERRPWSARRRYQRLPPRVSSAPVTADVRRFAEEGNDVVLRHLRVGTGRRHGTPSHANRDASFARSFDPCSLILTMHLADKTGGGGALLNISPLGKLGLPGRTSSGVSRSERSAARRVPLLDSFDCRAAWCVRKGRWSRPSSLRGNESRTGLVARTS